MGTRKAKTVFSADVEQMREVERLVEQGLYASPSQFLREAISEKLVRLERKRLARQVEQFCSNGEADDGADLVDWQAFEDS